MSGNEKKVKTLVSLISPHSCGHQRSYGGNEFRVHRPMKVTQKKRGNDIFHKHHNFSNLVQNFDEKSFRLGCLCFIFQN